LKKGGKANKSERAFKLRQCKKKQLKGA